MSANRLASQKKPSGLRAARDQVVRSATSRAYKCHGACGERVPVVGRYCETCLALRRRLTAIHNEDGLDSPAFKEFKRPTIEAYAARIAAGQRIFETTPTE